MDDLLLALSRRREVSWPTFRKHVETIVGGDWSASAVLNGLIACGHATATFEGGVGLVRIAPRVLVILPDHPVRRAVLVGHRTAETEQNLRWACGEHGAELEVRDDDGCSFAPRLLRVTGNPDSFLKIATAVDARFDPDPAAWRVTQFSGNLADYLSGLSWSSRPDLAGWDRRWFDTDELQFIPTDSQRDGLCEFSHPTTSRHIYWYRQDEKAAEVDRDWGRYLALKAARRTEILSSRDGNVLVPLGALPPAPLAAALGLCSCRPPRAVRSAPVWGLEYRDVPTEIAERVARKLDQTLTRPSPQPEE